MTESALVDVDERRRLMEKMRSGKKLTKEEAVRACDVLKELIQRNEDSRGELIIWLAAISARYSIEVRAD